MLPTTSCEITFSGFVVVLSVDDFTVVVVLVVGAGAGAGVVISRSRLSRNPGRILNGMFDFVVSHGGSGFGVDEVVVVVSEINKC